MQKKKRGSKTYLKPNQCRLVLKATEAIKITFNKLRNYDKNMLQMSEELASM